MQSNHHQQDQEELVLDNAQAAGNMLTPRNQHVEYQKSKFWVAKGNNSKTVQHVLKQRYWWQKGTAENFDECDFIWTSWKKQNHIDYLMNINH